MVLAAFAMSEAGTALRELETILDRSVGLEARYRYAAHALAAGRRRTRQVSDHPFLSHSGRYSRLSKEYLTPLA